MFPRYFFFLYTTNVLQFVCVCVCGGGGCLFLYIALKDESKGDWPQFCKFVICKLMYADPMHTPFPVFYSFKGSLCIDFGMDGVLNICYFKELYFTMC
jgi:hypothetical protein